MAAMAASSPSVVAAWAVGLIRVQRWRERVEAAAHVDSGASDGGPETSAATAAPQPPFADVVAAAEIGMRAVAAWRARDPVAAARELGLRRVREAMARRQAAESTGKVEEPDIEGGVQLSTGGSLAPVRAPSAFKARSRRMHTDKAQLPTDGDRVRGALAQLRKASPAHSAGPTAVRSARVGS